MLVHNSVYLCTLYTRILLLHIVEEQSSQPLSGGSKARYTGPGDTCRLSLPRKLLSYRMHAINRTRRGIVDADLLRPSRVHGKGSSGEHDRERHQADHNYALV